MEKEKTNKTEEIEDKKSVETRETKSSNSKSTENKSSDSSINNIKKSSPSGETTISEPKAGDKKKKQIPKIKKSQAVVNIQNLPISTKQSVAICRFIKGKKIENAINDLEQVIEQKKAVPMKGEIPHRKGKGMMSGRFPKKASQHFIKILKSLQANSNMSELDEPIIAEAIPNLASRPYGRFGRTRKKRTHVKLIAKEKKQIQQKTKKSKNKEKK